MEPSLECKFDGSGGAKQQWLSTLRHTKHWNVTVALKNAVIIRNALSSLEKKNRMVETKFLIFISIILVARFILKKRRRKFFFDGFLFGKYEEKKLFMAKYALSRVTQTVTAYSPPYSSLDQAFVSPAILGWRVSHTAFVSKYIGASLRTSNFFAGGKGRSN